MREHVELAYATTVHGAQGETVDHAHLLVGETTGAAAAYVGMTRGRHHNTAHLVADTLDDARDQWIEVFNRDRADLGPGHAAQTAAEDIDRYGPNAPEHSNALQAAALRPPPRPAPVPSPPSADVPTPDLIAGRPGSASDNCRRVRPQVSDSRRSRCSVHTRTSADHAGRTRTVSPALATPGPVTSTDEIPAP